MVEPARIRYRESVGASDFAKTLTLRVNAYFDERGISRNANLEMISKTVLGFLLWIATYAVLMANRLPPLGVVGIYVAHGFAQLYMAFNIAHDANHGAYSRNKRTNKLFACVFDLVGASSYMWRLYHNDSHHAFVNVRGADTALSSDNVFRFCPQERRLRRHRYQHLYAPLLYCLSTLDWVLAKDYRWLFRSSFGNRRVARHPPGELILLFATKAFYYGYMLVVPLLVLDVPWYAIVAGFVVMHFFLGFTSRSSSSPPTSPRAPPTSSRTRTARSPTTTSGTSSTPPPTSHAPIRSPTGFSAASTCTSSTTCSPASATSTTRR